MKEHDATSTPILLKKRLKYAGDVYAILVTQYGWTNEAAIELLDKCPAVVECETELANDYIDTGIRPEDIKQPTPPERPNFNSDSPKKQLLEIVRDTTIPYEYMDDPLIRKYGVYVNGVYPEWIWHDKKNLSNYGYESGYRPLEDAPEIDLYKIIALCEKHWREFYKLIYEKQKKINKEQETAKINSFSEIMSEVKIACSYGAGFSDGIEIQAKKIEAATQIYIAQLQINSK